MLLHMLTEFFFVILFPFCFPAPLEKYVIDVHKSALFNSILQQFQPCQVSLITNQQYNIQFLSSNTQAMQIFVFPDKNEQVILPRAFSKVKENSSYPVLYGQQYTVKFSTPTCKWNSVFVGRDYRSTPFDFVLQTFFPSSRAFDIVSNNHPTFRSVYGKSNTFYMLLNSRSESDATGTTPHIRQFKRFTLPVWTSMLIPPDKEFLKPKINISVSFTVSIGTENYLNGYSGVQWTCQTDEDSYFCKFT